MASTDFASVGAAVSAGKVTINRLTDYGIFKMRLTSFDKENLQKTETGKFQFFEDFPWSREYVLYLAPFDFHLFRMRS